MMIILLIINQLRPTPSRNAGPYCKSMQCGFLKTISWVRGRLKQLEVHQLVIIKYELVSIIRSSMLIQYLYIKI